MAYILRTQVKTKYLHQGLKSIYGINDFYVSIIYKKLGFHSKLLVKNLSDEQISSINDLVSELHLLIKSDLLRNVKTKINHLIAIKTYRGFRHRQGLPCRGQRTHTNARTQTKFKYNRKS